MSFDNVELHVVDSLAEVHNFFEWLVGQVDRCEMLAVDCETGSIFETADKPGLQWWTPHPFVRLVQFGTRDTAWTLPVREWRWVAEQALTYVRDSEAKVVGWNFNFDVHALENDGLPVPHWHNIHEGMFLSHLLTPHLRNGLKPTAERRLGKQATLGQQMLQTVMRENKWNWATVPVKCPEYSVYAGFDCIITRQLWDLLEPEVRAAGLWPAYEREHGCRAVLHRAESRGLLIDTEYTEKLQDEWAVEMVNLKMQLNGLGISNPSSNSQVEEILREMGWEPEDFTATGQAALDKAVKEKLLRTHPEVAEPLIRYQRLKKWSSVYLKAFLRDVDAQGCVHPGINTLQARTGRMSVTNPPLQTLPSRDMSIRRCVKAREGHRIWAFDYQAQEPRIFAHYCRDPEMIQALENGIDLYTYVAQVIYDDQTITKDHPLRDMFKVTLLAFLYGAYPEKIGFITGQSEAEATQMLDNLLGTFPGIRDLTGDEAIGGSYPGKPALAMRKRQESEGLAYILTAGGRRFAVPKGDERKATNGLMQGSAGDMTKAAINRLDMAGLADHILMVVHDEIIFELPDGPDASSIAKEIAGMMSDDSLSVPVPAEVKGSGPTWGQLEKEQ